MGTTNLTVNAQGPTANASLPVAVTLATDLPAKLDAQSSAARIARHVEIEFRVSARHQE